jgi:hypothetical protein
MVTAEKLECQSDERAMAMAQAQEERKAPAQETSLY